MTPVVRLVSVDDPDDPRLAEFRRLDDARHRRRLEGPGPFDPGFFVIEGWLALERAVATHQQLRSVLVLAGKEERAASLAANFDVPLFVAPREVIAEATGVDLHRGVVSTATRRRSVAAAQLLARSRAALACEGVTDGENLGALFRTAAALGADSVLLDPTCPDPLSRRVVRVSLGHVMTLPWAVTPLADILDRAAQAGTTVVGLSPSGDSRIDDVEPPPDSPLVIVVGAEGPGLSDQTLAACSTVAAIPMANAVDSLNVATAAGIALWELRARPTR